MIMTQKGQQSHFNVKFLKGYGFGINVKDNSTLILKNCYDPFSEPKTEEWSIRNLPYEKIVISDKKYISTEALKKLELHSKEERESEETEKTLLYEVEEQTR